MYRREFAKLIGMTGLSVMLPGTLARQARAQDQQVWGGPYFLHMHASGGWDPTIFCDGKLTSEGTTPDYENRVVKAVEVVNGVPVPTADANGEFTLKVNQAADPMEDPKDFFSRPELGGRVLVINGVDTQTNNHETGVQGLACGHNDVELPAIAALFAGSVVKDKNIPLAFLAHGQYNRTGDVVGVSRFPGDKVGLLADPFRANSNDEKMMVSEVAARRIAQLRGERLAALDAQPTLLPRNRRTLKAMIDASNGGGTLELLKALADDPAPTFESFRDSIAPSTVDYLSQPTNAQANAPSRFVANGAPLEVLLRCFAKGVSASATFAQGGFDTHDNHDINQQSAMAQFTARLRYVLLRSKQLGIDDKLYIMVTSDFGRTPKYNTGNGRDHWNVTSTILAGPGIGGGRALGKTDSTFKAMRVAKNDINATLEQDDNSGARIHPANIHTELRKKAGLDTIGTPFPLPALENALPLLG